jgi:hypothetical protein
MFDARVVGNFPSRRRKQMPKTIRTTLIAPDASIVEAELPLSDATAFLVLPTFARATILNAQRPTRGINVVGQETLWFGKDPTEVMKQSGAKGVQLKATLDANQFACFLAKIAYSYFVAEMGLFPRDETPLLRLIRGEADDAGCWIGSTPYTLTIEAKRPTHALGIVELHNGEGASNFAVKVKLFANTGVTGYEVVVRAPAWQTYVSQ